MVVSAGLVMLSDFFLDQSKSAPIAASTVVFNAIFASVFLKEKFTVVHTISVTLTTLGVILASLGNNAPSKELTFQEIIDDSTGDALTDLWATTCSAALFFGGIAVELARRKPAVLHTQRDRLALTFISPLIGGLCNGFATWGAKAVTTALGRDSSTALSQPQFYGFVVLAIVSVLMQVHFLNRGLAAAPALRIVPIFQSTVVLSNALGGIAFFHDLRTASAGNIVLFCFGAIVLCIGILTLLLLRPEIAMAKAGSNVVVAGAPGGAAGSGGVGSGGVGGSIREGAAALAAPASARRLRGRARRAAPSRAACHSRMRAAA
jgi:uncharacterized membrane protein